MLVFLHHIFERASWKFLRSIITTYDKAAITFLLPAALALLVLSIARLYIRKIRSHSFSVFNSRDNSQKICIQLRQRKTANRSHPPPSLFWRSIFFSVPLQKQKLINDLIYGVEPRMRAKLITCLFRPTFFRSGFSFL